MFSSIEREILKDHALRRGGSLRVAPARALPLDRDAIWAQLRDEAREELIRVNTWSKWAVISRATQHMDGAAPAKQWSAVNGALAQIIDLEGLSAAKKVEVSGSVEVSHYAQLTMQQLEALADQADALPPADDDSIVNVQGRLVEDD